MNTRYLLAVLVVLTVSLSPIATAPAGAQAAPAGPDGTPEPSTPSGPTTSEPTATPTGNSTANGSGGGWSIPGLNFNPVDAAGAVVDWAIGGVLEQAQTSITMGVEFIASLFSGMPAPGTWDDPSSWIEPTDNLWPAVWEAWTYAMAVALGLNAIGLTLAFRHDSTYEVRKSVKAHLTSLFAEILTFPITALGLHLAGLVSTGVAPGSEEFLGTGGGLARLGAGGVFAIALAYFATGVILLGLGVLLLQYILAHVVVFLWPLGWALRPYGGTMRSWGDIPIFLYGLLIGLNIIQAFILRFLFSIPWDATPFGPIVVVVATFVGLGFALVYLPKELLQQASDAAGVQLGVSTAEQKAPEAADHARERVGDSIDRVREWRSSSDEETSGVDTPAAGALPSTQTPGVSSAKTLRSRRAGSFGNSSAGRGGDAGASTPSDGGDGRDSSVDPNRGYQ